MAVVTLNTVNLILIIILIMLTGAILKLFRDLPKLTRPWILMLVSLLFFSVHYAAVVATEMDIGDPSTNSTIFEGFGTAFLIFLGLSLYSFWKAWGRTN
jgi:hypothetical protein